MKQLEYDDINAIRETLIGHRIVEVKTGMKRADIDPDSWDGSMPTTGYVLDNGTVLYAVDTDGGCACSNGCFKVTPGAEIPENVITGVEQVEEYEDGSQRDGSAHIRLFVYSEGKKTELFNSYGGDNGYYGWGHDIFVQVPTSAGVDTAPTQDSEADDAAR